MLVVDTCILIDIAEHDPEFGAPSAQCLAVHLDEGLTISPVTYVELAPVFDGSRRLLETFLDGVGVTYDSVFEATDKAAAFSAWARHISQRRAGRSNRRPVADALIGAMASRLDGIITRNASDFRAFYPDLKIIAF